MEIWDLYDRDGNKTGESWERHFNSYKQIPDGRYHMVVDILVQHVDGTYLLTKRHDGKDVYPGFWEASAGGSAVAGEEPLEAAKRELFEETGLTAFDFKLVSHTFRDPSHSMFYSYIATVDADKDSVVLQEGETVAYKWVDKMGFIEYAESDKSIKTHNSRYRELIAKLKAEMEQEYSGQEIIGDKSKTLYVTDLDGTLMRGDKSISEESISIINGLIKKGLKFTVATARSAMSVKHIVEPFDINIPLIIRNGTALADSKSLDIIEKALFTDEQTDELKKLLPELPGCGFTSIWHDNEMEKVFYNGEHSVGIQKYLDERKGEKGIRLVDSVEDLFTGDVGYITMIDDKEKLDPVYERVKRMEGWEAVLQKDAYDEEYWLELCPENSTKAKAIVKLKEKLGMERVVVFGDSVNDIPMFMIADEAFAVENALPELKEHATGIIASNEEDGVAHFLQKRLPALPDYNNCLVNLANSVLKKFGAETTADTLKLADSYLDKPYKNVVVLLLDAMGVSILDKHLAKDGFFRSHLAGEFHSVYPPTTVAATTSLLSGLYPNEHGWLGWDMYIPKLDKNVTLFTNTEQARDNEELVQAADYNVAFTELPYENIVDKINKAGGKAYFSMPFMPPYPQDPDAILERIESLCKEPGDKFIYAYWNEPDNTMHSTGTKSDSTHAVITELEKKVETLASKLEDTLLIITADHGHMDSRNICILDYPEVTECLLRMPSIEPRTINLFVKEEYKDTFPEIFKRNFGDDNFLLMTREEVLKQRVFGIGTDREGLADMIGDYVAFSIADVSIFVSQYEAQTMPGGHAGLTPEEYIIPLIVVRK